MRNYEQMSFAGKEPSVLAILEDPIESLDNKANLFEIYLHTPITQKRDYLKRWELFTSKEVGGILTHFQARKVIDKFIAFHNLNNTNEGEKAGHNTLTNFLFSDLFLPATVAIFEYGEKTNDIPTLKQSSLALLILNDALDILQTNNPHVLREFDQQNLLFIKQSKLAETILEPFDHQSKLDLPNTLPQLHVESMTGRNTDLQNFYCLMALARLTAFQTIQT
ncbi:MAG: hypothetical protein U0946_01565, partial [Patescibacteria group bacterium]|nr:hypothetical protein [Patescibacteria group bacterium]